MSKTQGKIKTKSVLTGVTPSGLPHLGNYLGAMKPAIEMQNQFDQAFYFIADLHSLTSLRDPKLRQEYTRGITLDYLALGLNPDKTIFFRQSDISEHTELAWILSCIAPYGLMERAHAWKDALAKGKKDPTVGLFTYPVLMAADILLYQPDIVPVGKDQKQHVEIARDLAEKFNTTYGQTFNLPTESTPEEVAIIPGTDGEKMSKSYNNTIQIFADEDTLKKQIMSIKTDSTPVEAPKNPEKDLVFQLYSHLASKEEIENLKNRYKSGGLGYGDAKKMLFAKCLDYFGPARQKRIELAQDLGYLDDVLKSGAIKAKKIASKTMETVRRAVGLVL
jgi:tryptophanyl-tRNA synthetase